MTQLISKTADVSLAGNFQDHLTFIRKGKHEKHAKQEAKRLQPMFAALSEFVSTYAFSQEQSEQMAPRLMDSLGKDKKVDVSAQDIEKTFLHLANTYKSLILSDMPITNMNALLPYFEKNEYEGGYNGKKSTSFPPTDYLIKYRGWGFVQEFIKGNNARVSMPVLGLSRKYDFTSIVDGNMGVIRQMELIGRICNHDWLHHMTMTKVNGTVVYTDEDNSDYRTDVSNAVSNLGNLGCDAEAYEAFCVKTHSQLLQTESAAPLIKVLEETVDALSENLNGLVKHVKASKAEDKEKQYGAIHELALTTARILRRIEPIESPLTQRFIESTVKMNVRNSLSREVRDRMWSVSTAKAGTLTSQATTSLKRQYEASGLFTKIYEDNEFTRNNQMHIAQLATAMKHYIAA